MILVCGMEEGMTCGDFVDGWEENMNRLFSPTSSAKSRQRLV